MYCLHVRDGHVTRLDGDEAEEAFALANPDMPVNIYGIHDGEILHDTVGIYADWAADIATTPESRVDMTAVRAWLRANGPKAGSRWKRC